MARFMLNVILILELHAYLVSSRGIMDRTMPTNISCPLDIEGAKAREVIQREGSVYINMDLKFVNPSGVEINQILIDTGTIVNIKRWVLAIGPRGVQLLKYPNNAVRLSLGTLKPGVERVSLNVLLSVECFVNAADDKKLDIIATSLANFQSAEGLKLDQAICLEELLTPPSITSSGKYYFDCWRLVIANEYYTDSTHIVFNVLVSIFVVHYLTFFLLSFIDRNPPLIENENTEYISISTDLNIGIKYVLFFVGNECCRSILYFLRCLVILSLWQYLPLILNHILVDEEYRSTDYLLASLIMNPITILSATVVLYMYKHSINHTRNPEYQIPDNPGFRSLCLYLGLNYDPSTYLIGFHNTVNMINQIQIKLLTFKCWKGVWEQAKQKYGCTFWTPFVFVYNCIWITFCTNPFLLMGVHFIYSMNPIGLLIFLLYICIFYGWLIWFSTYRVVINLLEILYYFFIGLLTNSTYIFDVVFIIFLIIVYFFTTITDFNAGYVKFLRQVIDSVDKVDEEHTADGGGIGRQSDLYIKRNGLTHIKKKFFDEIIGKYRPIGPKTVSMLVKLAISGLVIYIAADTLKSIDQIHILSVEVRSIPVIFIPLVIPFFYKLTKNEAQEENEIEVLKAHIEEDIKQRLEDPIEEDSEQSREDPKFK